MTEASSKVRSLRRLNAWQWWVLVSAPFVLLLNAFRLRTRGYRAALAATRQGREAPCSAAERLALARETEYALAVAVKYGPWRPRCLLRSLALGWFLGRKGVPFALRIGVPAGMARNSAGSHLNPLAHAWVEVDGRVINDRNEVADRYSPFVET